MAKILYFTSYFRLFKYMVSFSRYFTVCITYQPPLVILQTFMYTGFHIAGLGIFRNAVWCGIAWNELIHDLLLHCRHLNIILICLEYEHTHHKILFLSKSQCSLCWTSSLVIWQMEGVYLLWGVVWGWDTLLPLVRDLWLWPFWNVRIITLKYKR